MSLTAREPMRRCGRRWATEEAALHSKLYLAGGQEVVPCLYGCGGFHLVETSSAASQETGFPPAVKLMIRTRAGHGNPEDAHCEMCGCWLGRAGGQCHHRQNRQMGGSKLRNTVANGGLACGTPLTGCHGLATAEDKAMKDAGWVLKTGQDPLLVPVALTGGPQSGIWPVWLTADGGYSFDAPEGAEVA